MLNLTVGIKDSQTSYNDILVPTSIVTWQSYEISEKFEYFFLSFAEHWMASTGLLYTKAFAKELINSLKRGREQFKIKSITQKRKKNYPIWQDVKSLWQFWALILAKFPTSFGKCLCYLLGKSLWYRQIFIIVNGQILNK